MSRQAFDEFVFNRHLEHVLSTSVMEVVFTNLVSSIDPQLQSLHEMSSFQFSFFLLCHC